MYNEIGKHIGIIHISDRDLRVHLVVNNLDAHTVASNIKNNIMSTVKRVNLK